MLFRSVATPGVILSTTGVATLANSDVPAVAGNTDYAFDYWNNDTDTVKLTPGDATAPAGAYTGRSTLQFMALFAEDTKGDPDGDGDGTPDKYQVRTTYSIVGGYWSGTDDASKIIYVTLKNAGGESATAADGGTATLTNIPITTGAVAKPAYELPASWDTNPNTVASITVDSSYIYSFTSSDDDNGDGIPDKYQTKFVFKTGGNGTIGGGTADIEVWKNKIGSTADADWYDLGGGVILSTTGVATLANSDVPAVAGNTGYAFDYWNNDTDSTALTPEDETAPAGVYTGRMELQFTALFATDANDDDIPDKYQVRTAYSIVGGYWSGTDDAPKIIYVTLKNASGESATAARSEERRVGKECRSRWSPYH